MWMVFAGYRKVNCGAEAKCHIVGCHVSAGQVIRPTTVQRVHAQGRRALLPGQAEGFERSCDLYLERLKLSIVYLESHAG